ncbi:MAG: hypothetical protein K8I00_10590 [Candidatus Omnitrophica bacterium]|nr:hypothetical protein [Candidatus Omnitrophota bacterium]
MDDPTKLKKNAAIIRGFVEELRDVPYLSQEELNYLLDKYEAFLKKIYGDNCHQIRFMRRITFFSTAENTKPQIEMRIWYGGLNEIIILSNTLLLEFGDQPPEEEIEYELPEVADGEEEEEEDDDEYFPTEEAAEIGRRIKEVEEEEARKAAEARVKEKQTIPETPPDLKELEKKVDVIADVLTFIFDGFIWMLKGSWKTLNRLLAHPEKLFAEWKNKIASSMEYKTLESQDQQDGGDPV